MKHEVRFRPNGALACLTAAAALLASVPMANAQTAPGGGSFPGSFLVPGTNTSFKIGGAANIKFVEDMSAPNSGNGNNANDNIQTIALEGTAFHGNHGAFNINPINSNVFFDVRTPTAYGDLTIFLLADENGQNTQEPQLTSNSRNMRLSYVYGTLGGLLVGTAQSLMYDVDAIPEQVDATVASVGIMGPNTVRDVQIRYTQVINGGVSAALEIGNPEFGGINAAASGTVPASTTNANGVATVVSTATALGIDRRPDFIARLRLDQGWGHVGLQGVAKSFYMVASGENRAVDTTGYGVELTGHLNTFGKDTVKYGLEWGRGLDRYMSDYTGQGVSFNAATGAVSLNAEMGGNLAYTHWWTGTLRSTADIAYSQQKISKGIITSVALQNGVDRRHYLAFANLIWSPVPQVDFGLEYEWMKRVTQARNAGIGNQGFSNRIEAEAVFKF